MARQMNLSAGYPLDITTIDEVTGKIYDLRMQKGQTRLWGLLARQSPRLLVVSPPCATFSRLQHLRRTPMPEHERRDGLDLLEVAVKACSTQLKSGRTFIFEHPQSASSWEVPCLQQLREHPEVQVIDLDQCMFGLVSND